MRSIMIRMSRLAVVLLLVAAVVTMGTTLTFADEPAGSTVSVSLPAGGWAAYSFTYPGDGSNVGVTLTYSPVDGYTNAKNAITLDAYSPLNPPPNGSPIGLANLTEPGTEYWELGSDVGGNYIVIVHNWDPVGTGRAVTINLATTNVNQGSNGPALTLVSSGLPIGPTYTSVSEPTGSTASMSLPAGGWAAYSFTYPGDGSNVGVALTFSPVDGYTDAKGVITLDAYSPLDPPPNGTLIGSANQTGPGASYWELSSDIGGDYIVIVHNWDPFGDGRVVTVNLATKNVNQGGDGPALKFISSGQ